MDPLDLELETWESLQGCWELNQGPLAKAGSVLFLFLSFLDNQVNILLTFIAFKPVPCYTRQFCKTVCSTALSPLRPGLPESSPQ